ncbi:MAG: hypothetical protein E7658_00500 [Ruminococcaceae bacterium]|nr:hypothetical protein [Oscillospiraceae bacterium]
MKKQLKNLLAVLFAAVLFLAGCGADVSDETDAAETEVQASSELCLYENGTALYSIVMPDRCSEFAEEAGSFCWKTFVESYNAELAINNDWVADPASIPADTLEILIGNTNRAESAEVYATMDTYAYRITCINNRIVIAASTDTLLDEVLAVFFEQVQADENGRVTFPADFEASLTIAQHWENELGGVPLYEGGVISGAVTEEPWGFAGDNPSVLMGITETDADAFAAYIEKVQSEGFTTVLRGNSGGVIAYQCDKEDVSFYTYYTAGTNEVRIIRDNSKTASLEEFNYVREAAEGEYNEVYMVALKQFDPLIPASAEYKNNGMLMLIKLADNSLVVIDGGRVDQVDSDEFMKIAREVTCIPEGEKIRIACWFITHKHTDHIWGFDKVLKECTDELILERMLYNHKDGRDFVYNAETPNDKYCLPYENVMYHLPRTGETIQFGNLTMDVLYTQEDLINLGNGLYRTPENYNNSGTVLRVNFDGKTCIILGDIDVDASRIMMKNYTDEQLKCDVVQVAHHCYNNLPELYRIMDFHTALFPVARNEAHTNYYQVLECAEGIAEEEYFSGTETVGIRVVDGEMQVVYRRPGYFADAEVKIAP